MPEDTGPRAHDLSGWLRRRGWRGPRGPVQRAIRDTLRDYLRRERGGFTLREVMEDAGLDYDHTSDYFAAHTFVAAMRKVTVDFSDWFWGEPAYKAYRENGFTDKTVFKKVVAAMFSYDIYPISYDREAKKYRSLTLEAWVRIMKQRAVAIRTEFVRRAEEMTSMSKKFPVLRELYQVPALPTDGRFLALPGVRRFRCGKCSMAFVDQSSLEAHLQRRHNEG